MLAVVLPVMAGAGAVLYVFAGSWQQTLERELVESARRELVARVDTVPAGLQAGRDTLRLLERGGPFPYDKDGAVFLFLEGILPAKRRGYYHEYTVITPGENDRGARRIVTGSRDELYYTDDHYDSFKRILER